MTTTIPGRELLRRILQNFEDARKAPAPTPEAVLVDPKSRRALQILCEEKPATIAAYRAIYEISHSGFDKIFMKLARSGLLEEVPEGTPRIRATDLGRKEHARITHDGRTA